MNIDEVRDLYKKETKKLADRVYPHYHGACYYHEDFVAWLISKMEKPLEKFHPRKKKEKK